MAPWTTYIGVADHWLRNTGLDLQLGRGFRPLAINNNKVMCAYLRYFFRFLFSVDSFRRFVDDGPWRRRRRCRIARLSPLAEICGDDEYESAYTIRPIEKIPMRARANDTELFGSESTVCARHSRRSGSYRVHNKI